MRLCKEGSIAGEQFNIEECLLDANIRPCDLLPSNFCEILVLRQKLRYLPVGASATNGIMKNGQVGITVRTSAGNVPAKSELMIANKDYIATSFVDYCQDCRLEGFSVA